MNNQRNGWIRRYKLDLSKKKPEEQICFYSILINFGEFSNKNGYFSNLGQRKSHLLHMCSQEDKLLFRPWLYSLNLLIVPSEPSDCMICIWIIGNYTKFQLITIILQKKNCMTGSCVEPWHGLLYSISFHSISFFVILHNFVSTYIFCNLNVKFQSRLTLQSQLVGLRVDFVFSHHTN